MRLTTALLEYAVLELALADHAAVGSTPAAIEALLGELDARWYRLSDQDRRWLDARPAA